MIASLVKYINDNIIILIASYNSNPVFQKYAK